MKLYRYKVISLYTEWHKANSIFIVINWVYTVNLSAIIQIIIQKV